MGKKPRCALCHGPHPFDTSVPSELWNAVIRAAGTPDFLCLFCIIEKFSEAKKGFSAKLYGDGLGQVSIRMRVGVPYSVREDDLFSDDATGAVDFEECPWPVGRCRCGVCWICGYQKHTGIHGPVNGSGPGTKPYGHRFFPEREHESNRLVDAVDPVGG